MVQRGRQNVSVTPARLSNKYALQLTRYRLRTANKLRSGSFSLQIKDQSFGNNGRGQENEIINHSLNQASNW